MYRILVVDDEAKIRLLIRKYAEFEGHEVTEAENGMEAVRLFRKTPDAFDIVIMDVMMPELDGFSAVAEIKKIASPAVIMLSARGEEYDKIHGFELGVDDYVVKPFSPKELMMRVAAVMSRVQRTAIPKHELFRAEGLTIDFTGRIVTVDGVRADCLRRNTTCCFTWSTTATSPSHVKCLSQMFGGMISTVTTARWIRTSSCCAAASARTVNSL